MKKQLHDDDNDDEEGIVIENGNQCNSPQMHG